MSVCLSARISQKLHVQIYPNFLYEFYRDTEGRAVFKFRKIWPTGKNVKSCVIYLTKKNKNSPGSPAVATVLIKLKIRHGQPPTICSDVSRFHPNRFTFDGVIAERVNTAKTRRKVNRRILTVLTSTRVLVKVLGRVLEQKITR